MENVYLVQSSLREICVVIELAEKGVYAIFQCQASQGLRKGWIILTTLIWTSTGGKIVMAVRIASVRVGISDDDHHTNIRPP